MNNRDTCSLLLCVRWAVNVNIVLDTHRVTTPTCTLDIHGQTSMGQPCTKMHVLYCELQNLSLKIKGTKFMILVVDHML